MIPADLLRHIPGCESGRPAREVRVLAGGGRLNRCLDVSTDAGRFVLRMRIAAGERPGASAAQELRCHRAAAMHRIAPEILAAAPDGSWMLMPYVEAPVWRREDLPRPARLESLGQRLAQLHELSPAGVPSLDIEAIIEGQTALIQQRDPDATERLSTLRARGRSLSRDIAAQAVPVVLCHGDLSASNLLGEGPILVDWEYAQCADPVYDVACLMSYYPELEPEIDRLLGAAALDDASSRERLGLYRQLFELFNALWLEGQGGEHGDAAGLVRRPSAE